MRNLRKGHVLVKGIQLTGKNESIKWKISLHDCNGNLPGGGEVKQKKKKKGEKFEDNRLLEYTVV
jgi:hypothetical protein